MMPRGPTRSPHLQRRRHVETLLEHEAAFEQLEVLDVSKTWLFEAAVKRLRPIAKTIRADDCWVDEDPEYRYVRVGE